MKKILCFAAALTASTILAVPAARTAALERLPQGTQAIFLKSGETLRGKIVDVSIPQLDLKLENGAMIPLRDVWMINFETGDWDFPAERNIIESNDHYVFLKSGDIHSGRISAYSADQKSFVFETGEYFAFAQCRRIYFAKAVPRGLR